MTLVDPQVRPETFDEGKELLPPPGIEPDPPVLDPVAYSPCRMVLNSSSLCIGSSSDA